MNEQSEKSARKNEAVPVAWIAFIFAAIAMLLSIIAFNRAGTDLDEVVQREVLQYMQEAEIFALRTQANAELVALRTRIEAAQAGSAIAADVAQTREDIAEVYAGASEELQVQAREIDRGLEVIESSVRSDTAAGLDQLEDLINRIEMDVRSDEQ